MRTSERNLRQIGGGGWWIFGAAGTVGAFAVWAADGWWIDEIAAEDGIIETASALCWAVATSVFLYCGVMASGRSRVGCLIWAVVCIVCLGEEISWGQRVFGFATPEMLAANVQDEANLHNLPMFTPRMVKGPTDMITSQGAFYLAFFAYFLVLPTIGFGLWSKKRGWVWRFAGLRWSMLFAIWLPLLFSFALAVATSHGVSRAALTEYRELWFAVSCVAYVGWLTVHERVALVATPTASWGGPRDRGELAVPSPLQRKR